MGRNHKDVAISYNNIGHLYLDMENPSKAAEYLQTALEIRKMVHGENHSRTATSYFGLGQALFRLNDVETAKDCLFKSYDIYKTVFGEQHQTTTEIAEALKALFGISV